MAIGQQHRRGDRPRRLEQLAQGEQGLAQPIAADVETDVQFGVTQALIGQYVLHADEPAPASDVTGPWYSLAHHFTIEPGDAKLPAAPISGKASGARPTLEVLRAQRAV